MYELAQHVLYTHMELSQGNPLILLMYANSKMKLKVKTLKNLSIYLFI
jgi:hypothetical protein